jgi:protein-S-isoprenylcysteine O-methyltransferase Ste14
MIAFWSTPVMTVGHLVFAIATTLYMLIAIQLEERDLVSFHGEPYEQYRRQVSMLIPMPKKKVESEARSKAATGS